MMELQIHYYGILADQRGLMTENISTTAITPLDLYQELAKIYHFSVPTDSLRVAINDELISWTTLVKDGDTIVFMPPMSGG